MVTQILFSPSFQGFLIFFQFLKAIVEHCEKEMATHSLGDSCLENPVDRGAWWAVIHGVAQSWTPLK